MSDSENPQHEPAGDGAAASTGNGSPAPAATPGPQDGEAHGEAGAGGGRRARLPHVAVSKTVVWAVVALACIAAGTVASVLGARSVAHNDAVQAQAGYPHAATAITSTLKLSILHGEDLAISAATFFAANPNASAAEFSKWVKWARVLRRYPELQRLGFVMLVRGDELAAFRARVAGHPLKTVTATTALLPTTSATGTGTVASTSSAAVAAAAAAAARTAAAASGPISCLASVELSRHPRPHPSSSNFCAATPALLRSRDSTLAIYAPAGAGRNGQVAVVMPVYSGNQPPASVAGRRAAFVGWLREVLSPTAMFAQALSGHEGYAVRLRYKTRTSNMSFASGIAEAGGQSSTANLRGGWTARIFGPAPVSADVFSDSDAERLLTGGVLLSVLAGALLFLLGTAGSPAEAAPAKPAARPKPAQPSPREQLYDPLTGLPNRALMLDRCERMLARATRQSGLLVGALFIDIDWFKDVNQKLGEGAGDQLLKIVAERLANVVRTHDTVGRLGGDEFVVLVESAARGVRLDSLARRVIEALHKPVDVEGFGPSFSLTASIGVAFGRYATPDDLLRDAQLALTAAKAAGRDRYTLFNANMRSVIEGRGVLEVELNTALQDKQFFLLYEPVYDLATRRVVGLEAQIRWRHPTKGVLPPEDFMPLAEESGLVVPIGRWTLEQACVRAAAWNVAGHSGGVSVKVSPHQLNREGFVTDVLRSLQQSGIDPSLLTLEIAESNVMRNVAAATEQLTLIKRLGVCVAIDDFGSGYAHHSDLQQMPLDFLKVDLGSLAASDDEEYRGWLLQAVLIVGRDLSLPVIATGIESAEQLTALQAMGCPMAQGPLMGPPVPSEDVDRLFGRAFVQPEAAAATAASEPKLPDAGPVPPPPPSVPAPGTTPDPGPTPDPGSEPPA